MNLFAILFDMDGVLVDSNPFHKIALREFCKQHGYDLSEEQLREKIYGRTNRDWITNIFGTIPVEQLQHYALEKEALFRKLYANDIVPVKGIENFLTSLDQKGVKRAIATSAPRANVDFTLEKTKLQKYFTTILDDSFVSRGKPDPEIYLKSAAALDFHPRHCIVIEDSLSGVASGKAAGCKVVGITTTYTKEELHQADLLINDFDELTVEVLQNLMN